MKIVLHVALVVIIFGGMISVVHAHPVPLGVTVQEQNKIIFNSELGGYDEKIVSIPTQEKMNNNFGDHFVFVLSGIIAVIMSIVFVITHREDIHSIKIQ